MLVRHDDFISRSYLPNCGTYSRCSGQIMVDCSTFKGLNDIKTRNPIFVTSFDTVARRREIRHLRRIADCRQTFRLSKQVREIWRKCSCSDRCRDETRKYSGSSTTIVRFECLNRSVRGLLVKFVIVNCSPYCRVTNAYCD